MRWLALFALTSVAVAEQTCTLGRLFLSDVGSSDVLAIDLDTGAKTTIDGAGFSANPYIYASSAASHVFLNHRSENGVVRIVDAGFDFESHGDHYDISKGAPALLSLKVEGDMPTHVAQAHGQTTIFFDGRRESESSVIALDDTRGKLLGTEVVTTFTYGPMDPQHGNAAAMANNLYFVTAPNPDYKTSDSDSSLSLGVWVVDQQGNIVYDANIAGDPDRSCPAYHGHGEHGEYHVFGCEDGILVLHHNTATNAISSRKIPYHDTGRRTGSFYSHHENPVIIGSHSSPNALIRWRTGPADYEPSRDVLEFPEEERVCGAAFELVHGETFLVLVSNGTLLAYHVSDAWTPVASLPSVLPAFTCGGHGSNFPRLVPGYNRVFITVPDTKLVKEIKVGENYLELGREFSVDDIEPGFAAVAGLSASQAEVGACSEEGHDHDDHDHSTDEDAHDHDDDHADHNQEDNSNQIEKTTCTLGRLFLSDVGSSNVLAIDLDTGAKTTIDGAGFSANPYIYASSAASHVFLNHRSENGVVRIVDAGFDFESHGDHYDISKGAPALLSLKVEGDMPTHVAQAHGQTTIFFDGRRESESSVIALDDTRGKLLGTEVVTTFTYGPMDPQHGNAAAMANNLYFVTAPNPDYKTSDSDSSLSLGVWVVDQQGNIVYDANIAGDPDRSCPAYHGHGEHGEYHVFGCEDGILVLHHNTATNAISSRKIPYHDTGRRTGSFYSHHENPVIIGSHSSPNALIRWRTGPADYEPSRDVLEFPEEERVCGAAFELVHGETFLVLVSNGTLLAYHVSDAWTPVASLPSVLPAFTCGGHGSNFPRLVPGYNRVFITVPDTKLVKEIKVGENYLELGREFSVDDIEPGFAAVAGLSASQAEVGACSEEGHDHDDHEHSTDEDAHDHDDDHADHNHEDNSNQLEKTTCTLGRLFLSDVGSSNVLAIDLDTGAKTTIDGAGFSANPYIYASSAASHVFLNHRSENGVVRIVDAGFDFESHGDHYDISKGAPALLSLKVEGDMPTHVAQAHGQTTIFFDGRRESESSVIALDDTRGKLLGTEVVTTFTYGPMDPQHGNAAAMANNLYFVTAPNPDYKTSDSDSSLSLGVWVVDQQGNIVYDANIAGDPDRSCPAYHGHGEHGEYHVFGCEDGILVLHHNTATNAISSRKIPYHDTGRRTGSFYSHHENPVIIGSHSSPNALIRWRTGPADYEPSRDVLEFPEEERVCGAAFELVHGETFLVLVSNGTLLAYHVSDAWTPVASLPSVLPAFTCGGHGSNFPRLVPGYNRVFITVPDTKLVKEIKVGENYLELGREFSVDDIEPGFAAVAGLSASQAEVGACSGEEDGGHLDHDKACGVAWIGSTILKRGIYTIMMSKVSGEYSASSILMLVRKVGNDYEGELESLQEQAGTVMACEDDHVGHDHSGHDHRRAGLSETSGSQGSRLSLAGDQNLFSMEMDSAAAATVMTLDVPEDGTYLFFSSHAPSKFQDTKAWLLDPDGEEVEFKDIVGGAECKSELSSSEVWGYSFLGALICAITSLVGVLFLIPVLRNMREQLIIYLHSLAAGVLLALVVVHLIPEAIALSDKPWKVSTCVMAGFAAGLLIEHCIRIFTKGHAHHAQPNTTLHRSLPDPIPDAPVAAVQPAGSENNSCPSVMTGQPTSIPGTALSGPSLNSSAQPFEHAPIMMQNMLGQYYPRSGQQFVSHQPGMMYAHGVNFGQLAFPDVVSVQPQQLSVATGSNVSQLSLADLRNAMISGSALGLHTPDSEEPAPTSMEEGQAPLLAKATEVLPNAVALATNIVIGDLFHNFFDGIIIATGFRVCGHQMGWTLTAAAVVHEIPQELSDFIILVEAGLSVPMALGLNFLSSLSAILGVFVLLGLGEITEEVDHSMGIVLGMGAGVMLYIATSLIPGIVALEDFGKARLCWMAFAFGACCIGILQLWHDHCYCEEKLAPGVDPHAGHNH